MKPSIPGDTFWFIAACYIAEHLSPLSEAARLKLTEIQNGLVEDWRQIVSTSSEFDCPYLREDLEGIRSHGCKREELVWLLEMKGCGDSEGLLEEALGPTDEEIGPIPDYLKRFM